MRQLISKYKSDCRKCGKEIEIGQAIMYEKFTGVFCPGCEPTNPEEIRAYRQERADRKAERLRGWADKRKVDANRVLDYNHEHYTGDVAFMTQPGHIPGRERIFNQNHRACESLNIARKMESKADNISKVRVRGDAETEHQRKRDFMTANCKTGDTILWIGNVPLEIVKINKKTFTLKGGFGSFTADKSLCDLKK